MFLAKRLGALVSLMEPLTSQENMDKLQLRIHVVRLQFDHGLQQKFCVFEYARACGYLRHQTHAFDMRLILFHEKSA